MDLQGKPIPSGHKSTKATDSRTYNNPIIETSGPVANDSLAAESVRRGGEYAQNRGSQPLGVSGSSSTLNNTNISGASTLPAIPNHAGASSRHEDQPRTEKYPEELGGQGKYPGAHVPETGYVGGSTKAKQELGIRGHEYPASRRTIEDGENGYRSKFNDGQAPSYVNSVVDPVGNSKPKGTNLHEGGFNDNPRYNASFNSEIGSQKDPGRLAERNFEQDTFRTVGAGPAAYNLDKQTWYQPLNRDQSV